MKNILRTSALACALLAMTSGLSVSVAHAEESVELVRDAQLRLAGLGYYVGRTDGVMGPVTHDAIIAFQHNEGILATGELTPETFSRLSGHQLVLSYPLNYGTYTIDNRLAYYPTTYNGSLIVTDAGMIWENRSNFIHTETLPSRFARIDINEDDHDSLRNYVVTINDHAVLFANAQPYVLRVSQTFALNSGEDALIITARQGDGACTYRNYLLSVHRDGSFNTPREVGSCASAYEAHVADHALVVSFPGANPANGWNTWDMWRYENGSLIHI